MKRFLSKIWQLIVKLWQTTVKFFIWLYYQVKDWKNLVILGIVAAIVFSAGVAGVAAVLFLGDGKIHIISATLAVLAFWMGPFTPFWPLCIAITFLIRRCFDKNWKFKFDINNPSADK